jgi:hypothetical protein
VKPAKPPTFTVHVYYPATSLVPADATKLMWLDVPNGIKVTLDGAVLAARKHIQNFKGASCLVRRDGVNSLLIQRGASWDLTTGNPVSL